MMLCSQARRRPTSCAPLVRSRLHCCSTALQSATARVGQGQRTVCSATARFGLRDVELDLGSAGRSMRLVLPTDWRDVPQTRDDPPFWAVPWPSGTATALHLLGRPELVAGHRVCDLGCGLGPAGLAALLAGAADVTFADRSASALHCVTASVAANGLAGDRCVAHEMDWFEASSVRPLAACFDVVLACDVCYSLTTADSAGSTSLAAVSRAMQTLLAPGGTALVALPIDSEFRPHATREEADRCLAALPFTVEELTELSGAQLPGEGPEGLVESRRVLLARLSSGAS
eukprot:1359131-Prymnesium_polylepis.1